MQTLELENYGASELSFDEQIEIDGGNPWLFLGIAVVTAICWDSFMNPSGCVNAIKAGFESTQKK